MYVNYRVEMYDLSINMLYFIEMYEQFYTGDNIGTCIDILVFYLIKTLYFNSNFKIIHLK